MQLSNDEHIFAKSIQTPGTFEHDLHNRILKIRGIENINNGYNLEELIDKNIKYYTRTIIGLRIALTLLVILTLCLLT